MLAFGQHNVGQCGGQRPLNWAFWGHSVPGWGQTNKHTDKQFVNIYEYDLCKVAQPEFGQFCWS